ncbi:MAG: sialidase family protein [Mycobacteriales bacterium]
MDVESELRRVLLERPAPDVGDDVVPAVHAGMRRRRRRQRMQYVGAAAGVLAIWGGAVLALQPGRSTKEQVPTTLITNVPRGFQIRDLTFVSTSRGYGLGSVPCGSSRCTVLLQTDTGTRDWERAPAPLVPSALPNGQGCSAVPCVSQVRFATDAQGEEIGYAFGPSFLVFQNGEWSSQPAGRRVEALEAGKAGTVVRVLAREGGGHYVQQSTVGSSTWRTVLPVLAPTYHAVLRRQGPRLVLVTYDNNTGVEAEPDVSDQRFSTDGGSTWKKGAHNPCDADSYFRSVALGKQQQVVVLCSHRAGGSYVRLSEDNGIRFGPPRELPKGFDGTQVAAPAAGGWLVAGDVPDEAARVVVASSDGGIAWQRVATEQAPAGMTASGYLDNSNGKTVWWIGGDPRFVWRSDDGGKDWTAAKFR